LVENGGEFPGLPVFIGSGHRTQIPHVQWTDKVIEKGDNVPVELNRRDEALCRPLFRTFAVGASKKMAEDFEVVKISSKRRTLRFVPASRHRTSMPRQEGCRQARSTGIVHQAHRLFSRPQLLP